MLVAMVTVILVSYQLIYHLYAILVNATCAEKINKNLAF